VSRRDHDSEDIGGSHRDRDCNTRETVLKRDGTDVVQSSSCGATSGSWLSPYDGETWTAASDVDIDHVVPLSNAWKVSLDHLAGLTA
jgi:hypothetical protein